MEALPHCPTSHQALPRLITRSFRFLFLKGPSDEVSGPNLAEEARCGRYGLHVQRLSNLLEEGKRSVSYLIVLMEQLLLRILRQVVINGTIC